MSDDERKTAMELQLDELEQHFNQFLSTQRGKLESERGNRIEARLFIIIGLLCALCYLILSRLPAREDTVDA